MRLQWAQFHYVSAGAIKFLVEIMPIKITLAGAERLIIYCFKNTVVPWKSGPPVSPNIRVRNTVVSGYLGCLYSKNSGNNQHHQ